MIALKIMIANYGRKADVIRRSGGGMQWSGVETARNC